MEYLIIGLIAIGFCAIIINSFQMQNQDKKIKAYLREKERLEKLEIENE